MDAGGLTDTGQQGAAGEEEEVDGRLAGLDVAASLVDVGEKTDVVPEIVILALWIEPLELGLHTGALCFAASEEVNAWLACALDQVPERRLADAARCADEDGDKPGRQTSRDSGVRFSDGLQRNHVVPVGVGQLAAHDVREMGGDRGGSGGIWRDLAGMLCSIREREGL